MLSLRFVPASEAEPLSNLLAAWGLITIAKSMGKVKAKYRQMPASHNAGNKHMRYPIAVKSREHNSHLNSQLLSSYATCFVGKVCMQRGLLGVLLHKSVNLKLG